MCCEAWPLPLNSRKQKLKTFTHSRCTRDKGNVKSSQLKTTLIKHNPVYRDVKIDYNCLAAFPLEGIPNDLTNIDCNADSAIDTHLDEDRGPLDIKEIPWNEETELSSTLLNPVEIIKATKGANNGWSLTNTENTMAWKRYKGY